jgi:folylpolyglutamate synthase
MLDWTRKAGYNVEDFAKSGLRCIHVAGTKGKGSVCVMVENILLQYQKELNGGSSNGLGKIGLYTSPHLVHVRERIRINGFPISETLFARYFFDIWDQFSDAASKASHSNPTCAETKPGYFRYLTILAFHTFIEERVETAIVECGIGGEYDSTNILPPEAVTTSAITRLGIDHTGMLGETIEKIAWHKAGIMKPGVSAYTIEQAPEAQAVLEEKAKEKGVELIITKRRPGLDNGTIKLSLDGDFQKDNASLAIAVAASHLTALGITDQVPNTRELVQGSSTLPEKFIHGVETVTWSGRWQVIKDGNTEWYIDGAHTEDSIAATAIWFRRAMLSAMAEPNPPTETMLIFNQQDRDAKFLLSKLLTVLHRPQKDFAVAPVLKEYLHHPYDRFRRSRIPDLDEYMGKVLPQRIFTYAAFCTNTPFKHPDGEEVDVVLQEKLAKVYQTYENNVLYMVYGSIEEAVALARKVSEGDERVLVLVTGSLHLVGGLLKVLEKDKSDLNKVLS